MAARFPTCRQCASKLLTRTEYENGVCCRCTVSSWTPDYRDSIRRLIATALKSRDGRATGDEVREAYADAAKKQRETEDR